MRGLHLCRGARGALNQHEAHAEAYDELVNAILEPLDEDKMAELNAQFDLQGVPYERIAEDYLKEIGLL